MQLPVPLGGDEGNAHLRGRAAGAGVLQNVERSVMERATIEQIFSVMKTLLTTFWDISGAQIDNKDTDRAGSTYVEVCVLVFDKICLFPRRGLRADACLFDGVVTD